MVKKLNQAAEFEITNSVPVPTKRNRYPLAAMKLGESFIAPISERNKLSAATVHAKKTLNSVFTVRKINATHIRVWRIS